MRLAVGSGELAERLVQRREEIEAALLTRTYAIADPAEIGDPEYAQGLRAAVAAAIEHALQGIGTPLSGEEEVPGVLLVQARLAARSGVPLQTVLRRYFAGYVLFGDFLVEESAAIALDKASLKALLRAQAERFDAFVSAISEEYSRVATQPDSQRQREAKTVKRLLEGELVSSAELRYELEAHHLGLVAVGEGAEEAIRTLATELDRRLLLVHHDHRTLWGWLGGRQPLRVANAAQHAIDLAPAGTRLAFGAPAEELAGWRLTHHQAQAALAVALRTERWLVSYADVVLEAALLESELLADSLRHLYLEPLAQGRDGGERLRETLLAYLASGRQASSTAAALGTTRHTISRRLKVAEARLGKRLSECAAEVEAALRLEALFRGELP